MTNPIFEIINVYAASILEIVAKQGFSQVSADISLDFPNGRLSEIPPEFVSIFEKKYVRVAGASDGLGWTCTLTKDWWHPGRPKVCSASDTLINDLIEEIGQASRNFIFPVHYTHISAFVPEHEFVNQFSQSSNLCRIEQQEFVQAGKDYEQCYLSIAIGKIFGQNLPKGECR